MTQKEYQTVDIAQTPSMKRIAANIDALQVKYRLLEEAEKRRIGLQETSQEPTAQSSTPAEAGLPR